MDEKTINYIYYDVASTECLAKIRKLEKTNRRIMRVGRNLAVVALIGAVYLALTNVRILEQDKKINEMSKDIEEIKKSKGE